MQNLFLNTYLGDLFEKRNHRGVEKDWIFQELSSKLRLFLKCIAKCLSQILDPCTLQISGRFTTLRNNITAQGMLTDRWRSVNAVFLKVFKEIISALKHAIT